MKTTMSLLLMSVVGMVGTYAWAGSAREDSVARLQSSVDVIHAIMATPDKGIPEEVERCQMHRRRAEHDQRRICVWWQARPWRSFLPYC